MKSGTLYVIGNGFDRWHGIPSGPADFKQYVSSTDRSVYREIENYLPMDDEWNDLETALADMDADALIENLGHFMASYGAEDWSDSGHFDFQYEVQNVVERLSDGLRQRFAEWVRKLPIPGRATAQNMLAKLNRDAVFLSFNYTCTLSKLYGVSQENILFIHGCANKADDKLVLGHAWNPLTRKSLNDRYDISEIDTRLMEANNIIDGYFSATFKRSAELIAHHREFFDALTDIEQVVVLGHSLSDVDAEYFEALLEQRSVADAQWQVACRSAEEWPEKHERLIQLGIDPARASLVHWNAL